MAIGGMNVLKYFPKANVPVFINTNFGERRKGYYYGGGCFRLTDCTNPMQNCNLPYHYVVSWQYQYDIDYSADMEPNYFEHIANGNEILNQIKKPLLYRIKLFFQKIKYLI